MKYFDWTLLDKKSEEEIHMYKAENYKGFTNEQYTNESRLFFKECWQELCNYFEARFNRAF